MGLGIGCWDSASWAGARHLASWDSASWDSASWAGTGHRRLPQDAVEKPQDTNAYIGTVENHGKKWSKTRHVFVKIAKITAVYIAANLLKFMVSNSRKIYIIGNIHTTMKSRSRILTGSNKAHGLW